MSEQTPAPAFKPKKSVALSGTAAGNTALCTVGRSGNDLHYRGYDILDFANTSEFEEIAYLLVHGKLPNQAELAGYKAKLKSLRGIPAAVKAAREGKPLPQGSAFFVEVFGAKLDDNKNPVKGADGALVPDKLIFYTAMETQSGWGKDFPDLLRNGDWNYAVFTLDKKARPGVNQGECLACHKPLDKDSYIFTLAQLKAKAK